MIHAFSVGCLLSLVVFSTNSGKRSARSLLSLETPIGHFIEPIQQNSSVRVTPNWSGTFDTTSECNIQSCCCIHGRIALSTMKPNYLRIQSQVSGVGCPTDTQVNSIINMPTSFKTDILLMGGTVDVVLSADSRIMKLYNKNFPMCNGGAVRSSAVRRISAIDLRLLLILFLSLTLVNL